VPFAFWQGALALPAGMSEAMIAGWRAEVVSVWPRLADESVFSDALLDCQLVCVWQQEHRGLPHALPDVHGERIEVRVTPPHEARRRAARAARAARRRA